MMKKIGLLFLLVPAVAAAEVDTSEWACEYCPFDEGYRAKISAGATNVSDDAARFGNFTGYDEEGTYGNCVMCGIEIGEKRLMARPMATHCIDCKTEAETQDRIRGI